MPIPHFESMMLPLLKVLANSEEVSVQDAKNQLAAQLRLTDAEMSERLPSGLQTVFDNRFGWAGTYMKKAGLLAQPRRAYMKITARGTDVLDRNLGGIDCNYLNQWPEFLAWRTGVYSPPPVVPPNGRNPEKTPQEILEDAYLSIRKALAFELLAKVKSCSPAFFEKLVVELLVRMGYGGSLSEAGKAVGKAGDGGIDGIIKEDRLGLDIIYIQAKRWEGVVGRPELQKFVGALQMHWAKKGVFVTTSAFSLDARQYIERIDTRIVLIDGEQLAQFMIDFGLGVAREGMFEVKRIDSDYFTDE